MSHVCLHLSPGRAQYTRQLGSQLWLSMAMAGHRHLYQDT